MWFLFIYFLLFISASICDNFSHLNLPDAHIPYYFSNFPKQAEDCERGACPYKDALNQDSCWGYESNCDQAKRFSSPKCPGDHKGWVKSKSDQLDTFYTQADFGFIKQQLNEMKVLCEPLFLDDSSLECTEHLRFCRGRNIMINFTEISTRDNPIRYNNNVLKQGQIGGFCDLKADRLQAEADHISPLQSWGPELRFFERLPRRPIVEGDCDVVVDKPTFIMKIDATVNMYHHFCDFLNLYASLHLNASHPDAFSTDVNILIWESYTYRTSFQDTFKAFTTNQIWDLKMFEGDVICFKNVVFPLLPRMIFGLYYNTPIIYGCEKSGLFQAFSEHVLHRLNVPFHERNNRRIRITFLSRGTKYRTVLNEDELIAEIGKNDAYDVQRVVFNRQITFQDQLEISRNTDVFIGIHGAGLTHLLFLPEWAAVFELYNCEDPNCYFDLTRLRGLKYITWENLAKLKSVEDGTHEGGAHAKFANYSFDKKEFTRLVSKAADHVRNHPKFQSSIPGYENVHEEL